MELHFLHCSTKKAKIERKRLIKKVLQRLRSLRTSEPIMSLVGQILGSISNREDIVIDLDELRIDENSPLGRAIKGQKVIGWNDLCQGFYHKAWAQSQGEYYKQMGTRSKYLNIDLD